jgi:membrane-associated protease RseP (regulator of RpoE activity)
LVATFSGKIFDSCYENAGINIGYAINSTPAYELNVSGILYKINDTDIKNLNDLADFMVKVKPGDVLTLYTTEGVYSLKTINHPENSSMAYMGIGNLSNAYKYKSTGEYVAYTRIRVFITWLNLLMWIFVLNISVAIINMLPIRPLDGGLMYEEILSKKFGNRGKKALRVVEVVLILVLLFTIFGVYSIRRLI